MHHSGVGDGSPHIGDRTRQRLAEGAGLTVEFRVLNAVDLTEGGVVTAGLIEGILAIAGLAAGGGYPDQRGIRPARRSDPRPTL